MMGDPNRSNLDAHASILHGSGISTLLAQGLSAFTVAAVSNARETSTLNYFVDAFASSWTASISLTDDADGCSFA